MNPTELKQLQDIIDHWNYEADKLLRRYSELRRDGSSTVPTAQVTLAKHSMQMSCASQIQMFINKAKGLTDGNG